MRAFGILAAALAALCFVYSSIAPMASLEAAQPALERLEKQLGQKKKEPVPPPPPKQPETVPPAPKQPPAAGTGYLGLRADDRRDRGQGLRVIEIVVGAPAHQGGLRAGDLITAFNDKPAKSMADLTALMASARPGDKVKLTVRRGEASQSFEVTLGQSPRGRRSPDPVPPPPAEPRAVLGVLMRAVDPRTQQINNLPEPRGALIAQVISGGAAAQAGLTPGDVIVAIDEKPIATRGDVQQDIGARKPGDEVVISFYRRGKQEKRTVKLAAGERPRAFSPFRPFDPIPAPPRTSTIRELEQKIQQLEQRIQELEKKLAPPPAPKAT